MLAVILLVVAASSAVFAAPSPQTPASSTPNKSAFIPAFDEITVESMLTVKGRSGPTNPVQRVGRTKLLVVPTPGTPLNATTTTTTTTSSTSTTSGTGTSTPATVLT